MIGQNKKQCIFLIALSITLLISIPNVYAAGPTIEWQLFGYPAHIVEINTGSAGAFIPPVTLHIVDNNFVNGEFDSISVTVNSTNTGDSISIQLDETSDGIFDSGPIVFMEEYNGRVGADQSPIIVIEEPLLAGNNIPGEILSAENSTNGARIKSESDSNNGIKIDLVEEGDSGIFKKEIHFCTTNSCSDSSTSTLWVTEGDIISIFDLLNGSVFNGIITPTPPTKGAVAASLENSNDHIVATYGSESSTLELQKQPAPGRGGGGLIRPGLIVNALAGLTSGGGSSTVQIPTLGLDIFHNRIVENGFSFNGNPVNVELFYTPYPLITTPVGQNNTITLKIFENLGPSNVAHVGLSYGLGKGETFNEGRVTIEYDRTFDGLEKVTKFDPNDVIGSVNVTTSEVECSEDYEEICLEVTFHHIFRESLEYNMVATNIWDFQRNGWQNYFNHGIEVVGESMNPPDEFSGIYKGQIYHLTENGKNTAIDDYGNSWTFDKTWSRDYIKPIKEDAEILNENKIKAIEELGFEYSDAEKIFGVTRLDHRFKESQNQQKAEAEIIMNSICPECNEKSFKEINDIFFYNMPERHSKLVESSDIIKTENQKAQEFLKQYFALMYPSKNFN